MNRILYSCDIAYQVHIPPTTKLPHQGLGVVIGPEVVLGERVTIYQNVTLGAKSNGKDDGFPTIGNDVMIGCGAAVLGSVLVGNGVKIGANSVCTKNIKSNVTVAGNPAKII